MNCGSFPPDLETSQQSVQERTCVRRHFRLCHVADEAPGVREERAHMHSGRERLSSQQAQHVCVLCHHLALACTRTLCFGVETRTLCL